MSESADLIAGRYRLAARIGVGGMGVVWRARDEVLGRTVAIKELSAPATTSAAEDENTRRAMREARIAARLHHANVIGIYDVVDHDGRPFLVMEYLASRSLSQLMAAGELLTPPKAARIGAQLAGALTAAHDAGIVHRDVKPGNVLLGEDGSVKLTDFGISRAVGDTTVTASGILLGTLGYVPPETALGQPADNRGDVYSLGATLYAAIEGHAPFGDDANAVALMYRIVHEEIIPMRHAGPLEPVLLWMLQRDPALRPTMAQAQRALDGVEAASQHSPAVTAPILADPAPTVQAAPASVAQDDVAPERPNRRRSRRALIGALAAAAALALGGWAIAAWTQHGPQSPAARSSTSGARVTPSAPRSTLQSSHPATAATSAGATASASHAVSASAGPAGKDVAAQLASTIIDYYKLVPGDLDQAWNWMTADYQQNHAGGRSGYQSFWTQIQRVSVSHVTASPPSTVDATIDYYYKNGTFIEERTRFGLVFQQGRWKIASSSVLSHQER